MALSGVSFFFLLLILFHLISPSQYVPFPVFFISRLDTPHFHGAPRPGGLGIPPYFRTPFFFLLAGRTVFPPPPSLLVHYGWHTLLSFGHGRRFPGVLVCSSRALSSRSGLLSPSRPSRSGLLTTLCALWFLPSLSAPFWASAPRLLTSLALWMRLASLSSCLLRESYSLPLACLAVLIPYLLCRRYAPFSFLFSQPFHSTLKIHRHSPLVLCDPVVARRFRISSPRSTRIVHWS